MTLLTTLQRVVKDLYKNEGIRIFEDREGKIWMSWTGDRPKMLTNMLLNPYWDLRINYIEKRAQINLRIR